MNETVGLFPDIVVGNDDKRICLSRLNSNSHIILNVPKTHYSIKGNTITFYSACALSEDAVASLVDSGFAYRLLKTPEMIPESKRHSYDIENEELLKASMGGLYTITFILDNIGTLPELHYPHMVNNMRQFADVSLNSGRIKEVLHSLRTVRRIRLLSNDILNSESLTLKELRDRNLEVFVNQDYYINHLGEFSNLPTGCKVIVYLDDVEHIDEAMILPHHNESNASFFCEIKTFEDLRWCEKLNTPVTPFPSSGVPMELLHHMLDYSLNDLLRRMIYRDELLLKSSINPLFFGNIVVDNEGKISTYPFEDKEDSGEYDIGTFLKKVKNKYWDIRRPNYFNKCNNCALVGLCPPLSSFEMNLRQTFCLLV